MNLSLILDVVRFELARSLTVGRTVIWIVLVMFPIALMAVFLATNQSVEAEQLGIRLYYLVPEVTCLLALLLWATPAVSTEIEGQTWIYLAMRQSGRSLVMIGKYMTAVTWTLSATLVSTTVCVILLGSAGGFQLWAVMCVLCFLSCLAHASLYVLIGSFFFRRTMVSAVFYTLVFEYGISQVPALANKLTVNYRLRGLLADWMEWESARSAAEFNFGTEPASTHILVLAAITVSLLGIAIFRVGRGEFPTQQEG